MIRRWSISGKFGCPIGPRFPDLQCNECAFRNPSLLQGARKIEDRLVDGLGRKLERAEMHANAVFRAEVAMRLDSLCRIHMDRLHEPLRFIAADPEQRDIGTAEPSSDVGKMDGISGIAGEIDSATQDSIR